MIFGMCNIKSSKLSNMIALPSRNTYEPIFLVDIWTIKPPFRVFARYRYNPKFPYFTRVTVVR